MGPILVTGSSGHLGEALMRSLERDRLEAVGLDHRPGRFTAVTASICDREAARRALEGVRVVLHTAALHKPHAATHPAEQFIETNVRGTLVLLEEAVRAGVDAFVFTSTTSAFGSALRGSPGEPARWISEDVSPVARNIYGVTKTAAEELCELFARRDGLPLIVLRTSRFFPEEDDDPEIRRAYGLENSQANEFLYRRVDIADVVAAHRLAAQRAKTLGFGRYVVSATTPFRRSDAVRLGTDAEAVVAERFPDFRRLYALRGWRMFPTIDRIYDNRRARDELGWRPRYDFQHVLDCLAGSRDFRSLLSLEVGAKGYHDAPFEEGPYPVA
jgi:UDP-glucose 4-epimerase